MQQKFVPIWKGAFWSLVAIGEAVSVHNIISFMNDGYCSSLILPFILRCNIIAYGLFAISIIFSIGIVQILLFYVERLKKYIVHLWKTPKIKHWFELSATNDLRMLAKPSKLSKDVQVEYSVRDCKDIQGKSYINKYRHELQMLSPSQGGGLPFFKQILPDEGVEIFIGKDYKSNIALVFGDTYLYDFRDGVIEYIISCTGRYKGENFTLPDFSVWLIISNGKLIEIRRNKYE